MRDRTAINRAVTVAMGALLAVPGAARADTPAQVRQAIQAACDRAGGRSASYLSQQSEIAQAFTMKDTVTTAHCSVGAVTLSGGQAHATLTWHYMSTHHAPTFRVPYTFRRDYVEQAVWARGGGGWQEERAQIVQDTMMYRR